MTQTPKNIIFAGAPSTGKTTAFDLADIKIPRVPEIARLILEGGIFWKSIEEVRNAGHYDIFQTRVSFLSLQYEKNWHDSGGVAVDAGVVSAMAYVEDLQEDVRWRLLNVMRNHLQRCPPKMVFVFEPLGFVEDDGVRHKSQEFQRVIHDRIINICEEEDLMWKLVRNGTIEKRLAKVHKFAA